MDNFFDLFNKTDLENINKILITENEKDKVFKIYKNLKDSIYLAQIAEEIKNIKRRYLINQIGGARPNTRSVSAQNQVLNAPVSSGTRSRSSAAAAGSNGENGISNNRCRGNRGNQVNRGNRGNRANRGNPVNPGNPIINNVRGGTRANRGTRGTDWRRNRDRIGRDYEGLDRYLDEFEERIERNDSRFGNRRTGRIVADTNITNRRQIRENIQQISQRVDNLNNPIQFLRNENRNANQELVFDSNYFQIRLHRALRQNPRFNESNSSYEINFRNLPNNHITLQDILYTSIRELIRISFGDQIVNRRVRLAIYHDDLETPIGFPYMRRQDITTEMILAKFLLVAQSNRNLRIENNLIISASTIEEIVGGSSRLAKFIYKKQSIIQITNKDNLCACRAIVVGIAHNNFLEDPEKKTTYCQVIRKQLSLQTKLAEKLAKDVGINAKRTCSIDDIKKIEKYLSIYQILIVSSKNDFDFVYCGEAKDKKIVLFHNNNHYDYIKSLPAFFNEKKFCFVCFQPYQNDFFHKCIKICKFCERKTCKEEVINKCNNCNTNCLNDLCLLIHQEKVCPKYVKCTTCGRYQGKIHVCDGRWCLNCSKAVNMDHKCFILTQEERDKSKKRCVNGQIKNQTKGYIFFDYESMNLDGLHIPNLIIADKMCFDCIDRWKINEVRRTCESNCGIFHFNNNNDFCYWLLEQKNYTGFAHNLKAYDGIFIMKYIIDNPLPTDSLPKIVLNGLKLMSIEFEKLKLIDSHNFIPMPLSKFPKTFGFTELHKGYFPHHFNTPENQNKIFDSYPSKEYYGEKFMSVKDRNDFLNWHSKQNGLFNFNEELYKYCLSDVEILRNGCLSYRKIFLEISKKNNIGIDPFLNCVTLPSACHLIYRRNFMKSQSIALIPDYGFDPTQNFSHKQILWLKFISFKDRIQIQHCFNNLEKKIGPYPVDGYCKETDTVYEFQGCFMHGCPKCFNSNSFNPLKKQTMGYLYKTCSERTLFIKSIVKQFIEIWECEWDRNVKENTELKDFCSNTDVIPSLKPRDALFGGRTNAAKLYHKCDEGEKIKYYDVTSLYPFVQKTKPYPFGAPKIFTEVNTLDINNFFGLIQCKVLPPRNLRFPVLPTRIGNKLLFVLCYNCGVSKGEICNHNENERMLNGTWVTEEVKLALNHGYKITKIYSIWHWDKIEQYNEETKSGGLFTEYVNTFLKIKQENSGYPSWCQSESDKFKYIQDYEKFEGIQLNQNNICVNEGLRSISKFLLNSMWGRYCLQTNKIKYAMVSSLKELYNYLLDDFYEIHDIQFLSDSKAQIFYSEKDELHLGGKDSNVVLGSFVTCYGRMRLYEELFKIDARVLYFDTDSIIFISKANHYEPELADYLGKFTNEIKGDNYIEEFVSAGPKNYGYKLNNGETSCKIKGFSVNFIASESLNFQSMRDLVLNRNFEETIAVEQNKFIRDKKDWTIRTETMLKQYRQVYDKRILYENFETLPFGF